MTCIKVCIQKASSWWHKGNLYLFICILFGMFSCQHNNKAVDTALLANRNLQLIQKIFFYIYSLYLYFQIFQIDFRIESLSRQKSRRCLNMSAFWMHIKTWYSNLMHHSLQQSPHLAIGQSLPSHARFSKAWEQSIEEATLRPYNILITAAKNMLNHYWKKFSCNKAVWYDKDRKVLAAQLAGFENRGQRYRNAYTAALFYFTLQCQNKATALQATESSRTQLS